MVESNDEEDGSRRVSL